MKALRKALDRVKPHFEDGGKLHAFHSVYDGIETFLYTPRTVAAMEECTCTTQSTRSAP